MPTLPSHQGCAPIHSMVSWPSSASCTYGSHTPSESLRPRQSCMTHAYPASTKRSVHST